MHLDDARTDSYSQGGGGDGSLLDLLAAAAAASLDDVDDSVTMTVKQNHGDADNEDDSVFEGMQGIICIS